MTEAEWLACDLPYDMWGYLDNVVHAARRPAGRRKLRLFACACCRAMWQFLPEVDQRRAVEIAEAYADEQCDLAELAQAKDRAWHSNCNLVRQHIAKGRPRDQERSHVLLAAHAAGWVAHKQARAAAGKAAGNLQWIKTGQDQSRLICHLLRDLFGNPFRPVTVDPAWLRWSDGTVVKIAQGIYEERAFDRMPILADALLDAGCDNEDILSHCRGEGPHVRGCWVIDLILGKE
jgi:hypothetical protein